jgi:16S rRNA (cytidine1402-2'-O)-methyltransferase
VVSDAGTPGISDPAFLLTRACVQHQIKICCLPGPTALIPALVMSGLPSDTFHFEGFLPHKKGRSTRIKYLIALPNTFVLYESPFRLVKCLTEIMEAGGDRKAAVVREISKVFETCHSGTLSTLISYFSATTPKGEIVVIVEGADNKKAKNE